MTQSLWQPYPPDPAAPGHTVSGTVFVQHDVYSPQLGNRRSVWLYLPRDYATSGRRYPVIYMHDGQNLFDEATSFAGEWQVDETLERLASDGPSAIVVGVANGGATRMNEYNPFYHRRFGPGAGDLYLAFLSQTVKPAIDREWRTLPDPAHTFIAGSSMGGLISLYAILRYPHVFGGAGVFSPSLQLDDDIFHLAGAFATGWGRIYLDMGSAESENTIDAHWLVRRWVAWRMLFAARRMRWTLQQRGYRLGDNLHYVEGRGDMHNEDAWARRLPGALRFLLGAVS